MKNKPFIIWAGVLLFLAIIVSSYNVGKRSETIIIPSGEDNHVDDQKTRPFQVNTIYRLPKAGQLLGWSSPDSVVGFSREMGHPNVQRAVFSAFPPPMKKLKS